MIVLIINGAPQSGKDTFIDLLKEQNKLVRTYSSIDWVKRIAEFFEWDGKKDQKGRQLLSDLKTASMNYNDLIFNKIISTIKFYAKETFTEYFCINIREPEEIDKLVNWCKDKNIPCSTVLIRNLRAEQKALDEGFTSTGDLQYMDYEYNWILNNHGSKDLFKETIENFVQMNEAALNAPCL